jgi:serine/threonine-protein kinase RIO1
LRRDILNINDFFKKKGVFVFGMKVIFDYITDINIKDDEAEEKLEELI